MMDVEVLSVSVDSVFVHKVWSENELAKMNEEAVPYPMVSDQTGSIGRMYGVYEDEVGVDARSRFFIDPDGNIQGYEVQAPPIGRNMDEAIRQLQALQMVRKAQGKEVAPAGWKPGKETLKPGEDLVGNVWKEWKPSDAR